MTESWINGAGHTLSQLGIERMTPRPAIAHMRLWGPLPDCPEGDLKYKTCCHVRWEDTIHAERDFLGKLNFMLKGVRVRVCFMERGTPQQSRSQRRFRITVVGRPGFWTVFGVVPGHLPRDLADKIIKYVQEGKVR